MAGEKGRKGVGVAGDYLSRLVCCSKGACRLPTPTCNVQYPDRNTFVQFSGQSSPFDNKLDHIGLSLFL